MTSRLLKVFVFLFVFSTQFVFASNVGLLIVATGKYIKFVDPLIQSAEKHFCRNHNVTYFIFTDGSYKEAENIVTTFQARLGWPYDTMMRYHVYYNNRELFEAQDYLFACDADMLFVDDVGDEILGERVATQHPGFVGMRGTYETNPISTACVYENEEGQYFAGGFYGGTKEEVLRIFKTNIDNIEGDLSKGFIALWHDESHWNRYCINNKPTVILSPSYCYPETVFTQEKTRRHYTSLWGFPYPPKLVALDKNLHEFQITETNVHE